MSMQHYVASTMLPFSCFPRVGHVESYDVPRLQELWSAYASFLFSR